jgi:hypothetical protein
MRMFFGIVLGCVLTIGAAYAVDHMSSDNAVARPMVNWDVVAKNLDDVATKARDGWKKLTG